MVRVVKNLPSGHVKPRIHFFQAGQAPELPTDNLFMILSHHLQFTILLGVYENPLHASHL